MFRNVSRAHSPKLIQQLALSHFRNFRAIFKASTRIGMRYLHVNRCRHGRISSISTKPITSTKRLLEESAETGRVVPLTEQKLSGSLSGRLGKRKRRSTRDHGSNDTCFLSSQPSISAYCTYVFTRPIPKFETGPRVGDGSELAKAEASFQCCRLE